MSGERNRRERPGLARWALALIVFCFSSLAHQGHGPNQAWSACETLPRGEACQFENHQGDLFVGTCQAVSETLLCVRNQPIIRCRNSGATSDDLRIAASYTNPAEHRSNSCVNESSDTDSGPEPQGAL